MSIDEQFRNTGIAEVIVVLEDHASGKPAADAVAAHFTRSSLSRDSALMNDLYAGARRSAAANASCRYYANLGLMYGTVDPTGLNNLRRSPRVSSVEEAPALSLIKPVETKPTAATKGVTWGIQRLNIPSLWNAGFNGNGVLVGHLDTGVDGKHPALKGVVEHFAEFDALGQQITRAIASDSGTHGTHTAGTIAGRQVNGVSFGVAPGARLASAMVIEGGNVVARILGGMDWVVGLRARVLNMSLGLRGYTQSFLTLTRILRRRNILPVIAVGNEFAGTSRSPGNYPESLSVGASDEHDKVAHFSSSQRFDRQTEPLVPDLVGPGVGILSCVPNNGYAFSDGTSMAAPHIAGLAAVLFQASPASTVDEVELAIFGSCRRSKSMPTDRVNRGIPDAVQAFQNLLGGPPSALAVTPKTKTRTRTTSRRRTKKISVKSITATELSVREPARRPRR